MICSLSSPFFYFRLIGINSLPIISRAWVDSWCTPRACKSRHSPRPSTVRRIFKTTCTHVVVYRNIYTRRYCHSVPFLSILSFSFTLCLSFYRSLAASSPAISFRSSRLIYTAIVLQQPLTVIYMFAHPTVRHSFKASSTSPAPMILTPRKNDIRLIDNNPHYYREKYDGSHWRLVCTWHENYCTNFAYTCKLCVKHNAQSKNKPIPKRKKRSSRLPRGELKNTCDDLYLIFNFEL